MFRIGSVLEDGIFLILSSESEGACGCLWSHTLHGTKRVQAISEGWLTASGLWRAAESQRQTDLKPSTLVWTVDSSLVGASGREQSSEDRHEDRQQQSYQREGHPQQTSDLSPDQEEGRGDGTLVPGSREPAEVLHPLSSRPGTLQVPVNVS